MAKAKNPKPAAKAPGQRSRSATTPKAPIKPAAAVAAKSIAKPAPRPRGRPSKVIATVSAKPVATKPATPAELIADAIKPTLADPVAAALSGAEPIIDTAMKGHDMATTTETLKKNGEYSADRVQALFGDVNGTAKTALEKSTRLYEEVAELAKGNVEALVASSRIAAKGAEALGQEAAEYSKASFERASATFRSFATVKSPTELFKLQSDFAKTAFDDMVAESSKMSESLLKLVGEIAQPLSSRVALAAEKVKSAAF